MNVHQTVRRTAGLLLAMLVATGALAAVASAGGGKTFKAVITPASVPAGSTSAITATVTNNSDPQGVGSANLTVPSGWTALSATTTKGTATIAGQVVQLRNLALAPGQSAAVTMATRVPCGSTPGLYTIVAKQANDFNGTGNDVALDTAGSDLSIDRSGACGLRFVTQPPSDIGSGDPFTTSVEFVDGSGNRATAVSAPVSLSATGATLSGTTPVSASSGLATFAGMSLTTTADATPATLTASSPGYGSATSTPVTVHGDRTQCVPDVDCIGDEAYNYSYLGQQYTQKLHVVAKAAQPTPQLVVDHFYAPDPAAAGPGCSGDDLPAPVYGTFTALGRAVEATQTFDQRLTRPTNLVQDLLFGGRLRACIFVPASFQGSTQVTDPRTGKVGYQGIAQPCALLGIIPFTTQPCQTAQGTDAGGNPTVTVAFPAYSTDPNMR
ncbi:hypothetical protein NBH00_23390 [Paraconexibacter antarcticus]|uniref:Alpha-galactosidase NEW3 domain-containing protein n=1 Tax=Paraconexibacter antarcticus TaxID=2949664 RepID=A0ABY5DRI3_9ACTN|nr:hypothetical protein [Paraconexibacter antarcticus]UTI64271.1 hypothetical protein NBH00_23390 [Paraconexibacter antarcticus]